MSLDVVIGFAGLVLSVLTYFAGVQRGERQEIARREHEWSVEEDRRRHELATKMIDEFVEMRRRNYDAGPSALARLGLDQFGSDSMIREALKQMESRTGMILGQVTAMLLPMSTWSLSFDLCASMT